MAKPPSNNNISNSNSKPPRRPSPTTTTTSRTSSSSSPAHRTEVEILINIYDLLPPGKLSSLLWTFGSSLLHSGVVIHGKEYAYGGHNQRGVTGVYWTEPRLEPPGGRWRGEVKVGRAVDCELGEVDRIVGEVSERFLGPSYNLLTHNCNHFTSALCHALTSRPAPAYLNRAASIGLALPCMVPKEWLVTPPPDHESAEGELLNNNAHNNNHDNDDDDDDDEGSALVEFDRKRRRREEGSGDAGGSTSFVDEREVLPPARVVSLKRTTTMRRDEEGREVPVAERAPVTPLNNGWKA